MKKIGIVLGILEKVEHIFCKPGVKNLVSDHQVGLPLHIGLRRFRIKQFKLKDAETVKK